MKDQRVIDAWSEGARYWEKHRAVIEHMFAPVARALAQEAGVAPGRVVLDVATGQGEPALSIAGIVGATGRVVGVDVVPAMVAAAQHEAERRGLAHASFRTASADELPFADGSFDAVVSRFGVMFFPMPREALREMLRVLKPGGRLALAVWHHARDNPFHTVVADVLERFVPAPPPEPDALDAFRFAPSGKLLALLREVGAVHVEERLLRFPLDVPLDLEGFWTVRTEMSDKLRTKLAQLAPEEVGEIKRLVLAGARAYVQGGGLRFPGEVLLVTGQKGPGR